MNDVFKLEKVTDELVVIKVIADDNITVALHPYISREYDYITVSRGEVHILTVVKKDGSTFNFHWGKGGYTVISEALEVLKRKVIEFIEDNHIVLGLTTQNIKRVTVYYNDSFKKWQITFNDAAYYWSDKAKCLNDIALEANDWIKAAGLDVAGWTRVKGYCDYWKAVIG